MDQDLIVRAATSVGGMARLAKLLGISRSGLYQWRKVPAKRVLEVGRRTGVSRYILRPDVLASLTKKKVLETKK